MSSTLAQLQRMQEQIEKKKQAEIERLTKRIERKLVQFDNLGPKLRYASERAGHWSNIRDELLQKQTQITEEIEADEAALAKLTGEDQ